MDRYTKTILTVIAVSLAWIAFRDAPIISNALASTGVIEVKVVDMNISRYQPLPVKIEGVVKCSVK